MRWKAQNRRKVCELWEMTTSHIENCIRMLNERICYWEGGNYILPTAMHEASRTLRLMQFRKAMFQRELQYRSNEDYRLLAARLRKNKNDSTLYNVFADKCMELGYHVMARRLQRKGQAIIDALIQAEKLRKIICTDGIPELLSAAKELGKRMAQARNKRMRDILYDDWIQSRKG